MAFKKHEIRKKRFVQRGSLFGLFSSYKRLPYEMSWKNNKRRVKEVSISLEYVYQTDLSRILTHLSDLISSGNEIYAGNLKSTTKTAKTNRFNFVQYYQDSIHESTEREINGELKFVIKSKL